MKPSAIDPGRVARSSGGAAAITCPRVGQRHVLHLWAPVAFMWLMMSLEQPLVAVAVGRLPDAKLNLAAFGLTFSLALIIESPVIMLLTAATALVRDAHSYRTLLRFASVLAVGVGIVHVAVALTPAYDFLVGRLIGAPAELVAPGRTALLLMFAWSPAIALRRLWQGVMIRHGRARRVGVTTIVRIAVLGAVCAFGVWWGGLPGAWLAGVALGVAVTAEGLVAYILVRSTIREQLTDRRAEADVLGARRLLSFYVPLALTSLILMGGGPLLSFGLGRAPDALVALAVWPVATGLAFVLRSMAFAHQEVVVALLDRPGGRGALARFTTGLAVALSLALALLALSPVAALWLRHVTGLAPDLVAAARAALVVMVPTPALAVLVSWYRGRLVHLAQTAIITQAVAANLVVLAAALIAGLALVPTGHGGAEIAAAALVASLCAEVAWLRWRFSRLEPLRLVDAVPAPA